MQPIISQLVIKPPQRKTSDVGQWRTAMQSADMGRMKLLFDLYEDLLIDGVLADAVDKRISAVTNSPITFQDANGKDVPEITDLIDTPAFEELLTTIMQSRFWGRAAGEFTFAEEFGFTPLPFKHINLDNKSILINEYDEKGIDYSADDMILVLGRPAQFGLFLKTAPYAIWKRGGFGDYAQWLELFGMPQRVGKYSSYDPESRQTLVAAMEQAGSAPWIVIPKETEVETVNNTGTGSSSGAHNDFRKACNEELLITILGQTMTTLDGSSKSQSETHKEVEEGKNKSDMRYVRRILNRMVVPLLEKRGYPVKGGKFVFPESAIELTVDDIVSLSELIEIPASYLHDKYSIPVPENGEEIARASTASSGSATEPPKGGDKTPPATKPKGKVTDPAKPVKLADDPIIDHGAMEVRDQKYFWERFFDFFVAAPGRGAMNGNRRTSVELSDTGEFSDTDFLKRVYDSKPYFDIQLFNHISSNLIEKFREGWKNDAVKLADIGFSYGYTSEVAQTAMELNLFHFSAAKTLAECQELNSIFRESKSFDEFVKAASVKHDLFNKTWAETEYNTAYLTAESSATYYRLKDQSDIFPAWEYKTQDDNHVRVSHAALNGLTLPYNDPLWNRIMPPNDWNCRCYIVGRTKSESKNISYADERQKANEYISTPEFEKAKAQGWGVNRAEQKQVFTADQMYIKRFPGASSKGIITDEVKHITKLDYTDYGLSGISTEMKTAANPANKYVGEAEAWFNSQSKNSGDLILKDYNNRHVALTEENFKYHTTGNKSDRVLLLDAMKEVLVKPNEVWLNGVGLNDLYLLKFYNDKTVVVWCKVENGNISTVHSWFELALKKKVIRKYRGGLLIKKAE